MTEDTIIYFKSPREVRQCKVYLTSKRIAAYNKRSSFRKAIANLLNEPNELIFDISLNNISSMRDGRCGPKNVVILKTNNGVEYPIHFNLPSQGWRKAIIDTIAKDEPDITVKTVGDYVRFKRVQPRL